MLLDEFLEINSLLDIYKNLLSEKQRKYLLEYYGNNYTLTEIAEEHGISRQAVYDNIRRGVNTLKDHEKKLQILENKNKLKEELKHLKQNFTVDNLNKIIEDLF